MFSPQFSPIISSISLFLGINQFVNNHSDKTMLKKLVLSAVAAICLLQPFTGFSHETSPIETFIRNVKKTDQFVRVDNIWFADNNFDKTELLKNVENAQPLGVDYVQLAIFMNQKHRAIELVIPGVDGKAHVIELATYEILTNDFSAQALTDHGIEPFSYTPGLYYRGVVKGVPGSVAAFSFFNNEIYGTFSTPEEGNFVVAPNTMVGKDYDFNKSYIVYNDNDIKFKEKAPGCSADGLPETQAYKNAAKTTTILNNKVFNSCKEIRIFETADYSMYTRKGSSTTNSTNYLTALFNNKAVLYKNEGVMIFLKKIQVNTSSSDPYATLPANSGRWLTKFSWITQNTLYGCDVATLFTTKYGSMGGVAWLSTLCNSYYAPDSAGPYSFCNINNTTGLTVASFPTYSWDVMVSAHELGHNLGSPHTHRCCWNPPARNTVIDICQTKEGSCPNPSVWYPAGGGTIMSYCHLQSVGINFSKGFSKQPGDTIKHRINVSGSSCGEIYKPNIPAVRTNRTIVANNECTDPNTFFTYYWKDGNTWKHDDDTLVMIIKKNGNDIGDLNDTSFSISTTVATGYAGGTGITTTFPSGTIGAVAGASNYAMRRYWTAKFAGTIDSTNPVDIMLPFTAADTVDINGSVPGPTAPMKNMKVYTLQSVKDANPANNFPTATSADFKILGNSASLVANKWISYPFSGGPLLAYFRASKFFGGGIFYPNGNPVEVAGIEPTTGIQIYPNPTSGEWNITIAQDLGSNFEIKLMTADGRTVVSQSLQTGMNVISASNLPVGMYFYRIVGGEQVYTGTLMKQ